MYLKIPNPLQALRPLIVIAATLAAAHPAFAQTADIVFTNADVRTMDEANPRAAAVAITGRAISYVDEIRDSGNDNVILSTTHSWWVRPQDRLRWVESNVIVLSDNLYEIEVEDIANTTVLLTMMDGSITYAEPSAAAAALDDPKIQYGWQQ